MRGQRTRLPSQENEDILRDLFGGIGISCHSQRGSVDQSGVAIQQIAKGVVRTAQVA
jgi:hypothetical protein